MSPIRISTSTPSQALSWAIKCPCLDCKFANYCFLDDMLYEVGFLSVPQNSCASGWWTSSFIVEYMADNLESKYLQYCDTSVPLSWATSMVARMIMARMWLIVHKPLLRQEGETSLRNPDHERVLSTRQEKARFARFRDLPPELILEMMK
ncbi:MAG: hypothetical protein Q9226_001361 [Calogaya cf. arnoldii]